MEPFRFRSFAVYHHNSTMKVGTDAVLLGAWANAGKATSILDIGTGCGVIALIAAQRSHAIVDAIDMDKASIDEARSNFLSSRWKDRLSAVHTRLQDWKPTHLYDLILSNPPYFTGQLRPCNARRDQARHTTHLSTDELAGNSIRLLQPGGRVAIITPYGLAEHFEEQFINAGAHLIRSRAVLPREGEAPTLLLQEYSLTETTHTVEEPLPLVNPSGQRTYAYASLTRDLYL